MACYYLVISSTHLSNGHLRSIKGVFRGPLCASGGTESPQDYAEKEKAITKALEDLKANFYCELCDKQYHKHQEFDNHINSYDHAHKQRLKDLKQREFARNVSSKSWKDDKKQERALKRLHKIALLKQQRDSDKSESPKLKVASRDQHQNKIKLHGSAKPGSRHISSHSESPLSPNLAARSSSSASVFTNQYSVRVPCSSSLPQTLKGHRHSRAGVSFCFSRRAHLKLESCASVFNDGLDDSSDQQERKQQQQNIALKTLWSQTSLSTPYQHDDNLCLGSATLQTQQHPKQLNQEDRLEIKKVQIQECPNSHASAAEKLSDSEASKVAQDQKPRQDGIYRGFLANSTAHTDGHNNMASRQVNKQKELLEDVPPKRKHTVMTVNCLSETNIAERDTEGKHFSFLDVLSKDGTNLKWPFELVRYTSDEPHVSYSCNPLCLTSECKQIKEKITEVEKFNVYSNSTLSNQVNKAEEPAQDVANTKLGILKPKKHKHKLRRRGCKHKLNTVKRHHIGCAFNSFSQIPARGHCEFNKSLAKTLHFRQRCNKKRHKLRGKKRQSVNDEDLNDTQQLSIKSIIVNAFAGQACRREKQQKLPSAVYLTKRRAFPHASIQSPVGSEENYQWFDGLCKSKRDPSVTPQREKSGSFELQSDLSSDGEWPALEWERHCPSPRSTSSYSWRRGHHHSCSYIRKSSCSFPCYDYRHMSDSQGIDTECKEVCWAYNGSEIYREQNYSGLHESPCIIKQRNSFKRRKRCLKQNRFRESQSLGTKKICFYKVYEDDNPRNTLRDWWYERPSPDHRRQRDRNRFCTNSELDQERGYYQSSSMSRHSPTSSSITSISDLSGDCDSHIEPSCSRQSQTHPSDLTWPIEKSAQTKACHSREHIQKEKCHSVTLTPATIPEKTQPDPKPVISNSGKHEVTVTKKLDSTELSTSPDKKVIGNGKRTLSLPLIGKLPCIRKGTKQAGIHKEKDKTCNNQILNVQTKSGSQLAFETGLISTQTPRKTETNHSIPSQVCPPLTDQRTLDPSAISDSKNSSMSPGNLNKILKQTSKNHKQSCQTPPLTEKPITFTEEEIDKYRLLQLQAQQHMQQQHLQEQQDMTGHLSAVDVPPMDCLPIPVLEPLNHSVPAPCHPYTIHQHGALSTFSASISSASCFASHKSPSVLHPCPSQSHVTPFPFPAIFYPASPAVVLAAHPFQMISATTLPPPHPHTHSPGLTIHPPPHSSLLSSLLAQTPMVPTRTLQIHPILHPFLPCQNQPYSGIAS